MLSGMSFFMQQRIEHDPNCLDNTWHFVARRAYALQVCIV